MTDAAPGTAGHPIPARLLLDPGHCVALGFGAGLMPRAPGTAGTVVGVCLYLGLVHGIGDWTAYTLVTVALGLAGVALSGRLARTLGVHDHGAIVVDEMVGFLVAMWMVPPTPLAVLVGFGLFRLFDIAKPWPISWADRQLRGGLGIMLDDVLAGVASAICLHALAFVGLPFY